MGKPKNHNRNVHAIVVHGGDKWDLNCTYNFLSAIKSCYSRSIIPHALSSCNRDELFELIKFAELENQGAQPKPPTPHCAPFLGSTCIPPIKGSENPPMLSKSHYTPIVTKEGFLPGHPEPPPIPTAQEADEILEVLRPFYRCVQQEDIKLELRSHLQTLAPTLKSSSRLLVIICAQGVHASGCIVLGRTIVNQDIMEYIESLPLKSTAVIASLAAGLDDWKEIPDIWETADELANAEARSRNSSIGIVYTAARIEIIKPLAELSVGHEVRMVKDAGSSRQMMDNFMDYRPLKLAPWCYSPKEWRAVDSVTDYVEKIIDKHIVGPRRLAPLIRAKDTIDRGVRIVKKQEPLDLAIYYLELKLKELSEKEEEEEPAEGLAYKHARKGMLALEGMMKRVIDQNRNYMDAAHIISSSSLFQQRVEETLRFMERMDIRAQAFIQGAYKSGILRFMDASEIGLHPEAKGRLLESVRTLCPAINSVMVPPKNCVGMEYWDQADWILRLMQGHIWKYRWFRSERFLEYMDTNL
ncbi:hypothetical protein TWF281_001697 [Arthrobotrys megalospora]